MVCIMAIVWWNDEDSDDEPTNHFSHLRTHFTYCVARYQLCPLEPQSCLEKEEPPPAAAPKKEDMFCWSNFHEPLDPKKNTPHTTFGGLWGQNSLSFQTNASWAAHQNHFNKLRNVFWGMEMSRNSFSKMGFLLRVVTSQSGCQKKLVATKIKNRFVEFLFFWLCPNLFLFGEISKKFLGMEFLHRIFVTKLRSINRINRHCWAVRGQNHGAHQASKGWGAYPRGQGHKNGQRWWFFSLAWGFGDIPPK